MTNLRLVILFLGAVAVIGLGSITYLAANGVPIPDVLVAIPSGAVASLGTLLTQRPRAPRRKTPAA